MTERTESVVQSQVTHAESDVPDTDDVGTTTVETEQAPPPELAKLLAKFRRLCSSAAEVALEEGRVARQYVAAWCGQGDAYKRAAGIATLVAELQLHSPDVVRSQRIDTLIRHTATYDVLAEETGRGTVKGKGKAGTKPSIRVILAFAPLMERDEVRRDEHWQLTPATAERAKALWVEMLDTGAPGTVAEVSVTKLLAEYKAERATELAKLAQEQPDNQNAQAEARKAQAEADKAAARLADKGTETPKPSSKLPRGAGIDDVPAFVYDRVAASEEPDDLLESILAGLKGHPALSKRGHRAIDAALFILSTGMTPKAEEPANGQMAKVA
jgi:hypothetical protein